MNRYAVQIGSVLALALVFFLGAQTRASAAPIAYTYQGKQIVFSTARSQSAGPAVSADDPGLRALVRAAGGMLSWDADNQYVLITFPGPTVISFAIGDAHYLAGPISRTAEFAPFLLDGHPYVPLDDVLRAMKLPPLQRGGNPQPATPVPSPSVLPQSSPAAATPQPQQSIQFAQVTAVDVQPQDNGAVVRVTVAGNGAYDWHRLRPPDNRWWIDLHDARLTISAIDRAASSPLTGIRVHQQDPTTVRVALSLDNFDDVTVAPDERGVTITVSNNAAAADVARSGSGRFGANAVAAASPAPSPSAGVHYVATNPKLIVIDPGHGGSDPGTVRGSDEEKTFTLDISKRVRDILIARGWQVVMTRDDDRDVYAPNDSAPDELQARDDVANSRGARAFVSIHANSYVNAGPHGVTAYYYKPSDVALARAIDRRVASEVGISNNGIVKDKLYVMNHARMPAALIETAFMSNPDDLALLESPAWRQKMAQAIADGIVDYTVSGL